MQTQTATNSPARKPTKKATVKATVKAAPRDVCAEITAKLVEALEKGVAPWIKPWNGDAGVPRLSGMPRNAVTGKTYRGANVLVLWCAGFSDPRWVTFQQALSLGGCVRKGEKGQTVCWWSPVTRREESTDETKDGENTETPRTRLICRAYTVFNVSQCDGLKLDEIQAPPVVDVTSENVADTTAARVGAKVVLGGDRAYYSIMQDYIGMPVRAAFEDDGAYTATLLHELTHWTGAPGRCDRKFGTRFGDSTYAFEELVAEIGSAFACAHLGVAGRLQHAEYLGHWAKVLKADKFAIFTAAREAEKALRMLVPSMEPKDEATETA